MQEVKKSARRSTPAAPGIPGDDQTPKLSVIVPVLHEGARINDLLRHVKALQSPVPIEILVVDAEDAADTLATLAAHAAHAAHATDDSFGQGASCQDVIPLLAPRGRARQLNAGAARARGRALLFLHADTRLPPDGLALVWRTLFPDDGSRPAAAGAFSLGYAEGGRALQAMARLASWRNRVLATPYGDQAQFFCAEAFRALGGYPQVPLMEDVEIMRAVRRRGLRLVILSQRVATSARRYRAGGLLRTGLRNNLLRLLHACGVSPQHLKQWY